MAEDPHVVRTAPDPRSARPPAEPAAETRAEDPRSTPSDAAAPGPGSNLDHVPGMARVAASAYVRAAGWGLKASLQVNRRLLQAAFSPQAAVELVRDTQQLVGRVTAAIADATDVEDLVRTQTAGNPTARAAATAAASAVASATQAAARVAAPPAGQAQARSNGDRAGRPSDRGAELLHQSRDVRYEEEAHPAYERMLTELAPDELRILRLMLLQGPQPAVDVRTGGPLGVFNSELIAPGLSMIGARAGCRYVERVPAYLNNLFRLGLIWFSRDPVSELAPYQVLEAQPYVTAALKEAGRGTTVRRSIRLTPFGQQFCAACLPEGTTEFAVIGAPEDHAFDAVPAPGAGEPPEL